LEVSSLGNGIEDDCRLGAVAKARGSQPREARHVPPRPVELLEEPALFIGVNDTPAIRCADSSMSIVIVAASCAMAASAPGISVDPTPAAEHIR